MQLIGTEQARKGFSVWARPRVYMQALLRVLDDLGL